MKINRSVLGACVWSVGIGLGSFGPAPAWGSRLSDAVQVTLTAYWAKGGGTDKWTRRKQACVPGVRLVEGLHVAVDPAVFPYGSILDIEGVGRRLAADTGSWVKSRRASRKRGVSYPVIDVFFEHSKGGKGWARKVPAFTPAAVVGTVPASAIPKIKDPKDLEEFVGKTGKVRKASQAGRSAKEARIRRAERGFTNGSRGD